MPQAPEAQASIIVLVLTSCSRAASLSREKQLSGGVSVKMPCGSEPCRPGQHQVFFLKLGGGLLHVAMAGLR